MSRVVVVKEGGMRLIGWGVAGAVCAVVAWLLLVPWDLSTVDESGELIAGGNERGAGGMVVVFVVIVALGLIIAFRGARATSVTLTAAGTATWMSLFAWRTATARVIGANLFIVPLIVLVLPAAIIGPVVVLAVATVRQRRHARD
jgi:predicted neutral ceramidase superfamily lipid hydrolase